MFSLKYEKNTNIDTNIDKHSIDRGDSKDGRLEPFDWKQQRVN